MGAASPRGGKTYSIERPVISLIRSAVEVSAADEPGGDGAAVLEDRDAVADLADLLESVGDVDDGDALGGEVADDPEEVVDLALVEHGGRLVEDEQPGVMRQGARHADDLLRGRATGGRPTRVGEISV